MSRDLIASKDIHLTVLTLCYVFPLPNACAHTSSVNAHESSLPSITEIMPMLSCKGLLLSS